MKWSENEQTVTANRLAKKAGAHPKQKKKKHSEDEDDCDDDDHDDDYAHELMYQDDDGDGYDDAGRGPMPKQRPETDVLEVWFAGCHCGTY